MDFNQTYELKNGCRQFNYFKCLQYIEHQGRVLYGNNFCIRPSQRKQLQKLLAYATENHEECALYGVDLQKGLLVTGPENSGKTSLMHLLKPFFDPKPRYMIRSCREIAFCYQRFGKQTLQQYVSCRMNYCFDDLGLESTTANNREVVKNMLYHRVAHTWGITHIISNKNTDVLAALYGDAFAKMLLKHFNSITFTESFHF